MATFKATSNKKDNGVGVFKATKHKSYDATTINRWEDESKEAGSIINDYITRRKNQDWMSEDDISNYRSALERYKSSSSSLISLQKSSGNYKEEDEKKWNEYISSLSTDLDTASEFYGKYKTADSYKSAIAAQKEREELKTLDLDAFKKDVDYYKGFVDAFDELKSINDELSTLEYAANFSAERRAELDAKKKRKAYLEQWLSDVDEDDYRNKWSTANSKYTRAQSIQEEERVLSQLSGVNDPTSKSYDPAYADYVQKGASIENPSYFESLSPVDIFGWKPFGDGKEVNNPVTFSLDNKGKFAQGAGTNAPSRTDTMDQIVLDMSQEEIDNYNYLIAKYGREDADIYLEAVRTGVRGEKAEEFFEKHLEGKWLGEFMYSVAVQGTDQFSTNMGTLFGNDYADKRVIDPQLIGSMAREDLGDVDLLWYNIKEGKWDEQDIFGSSLGQAVYDLGTTTGNMLPSMAAGGIVGTINPVAGAWTTYSLMGLSSGAGAYKDALNRGYTDEQARTYGTMIGTSEALLGKLLGSIGNAGSSLTGKAISKMVNGLDNAFAKFAIQYGGSIASEALEEGLQEVLNPLFENIAFDAGNTWEDVDWEQVGYSALLGGLSAGLLEGPGIAASNISRSITANREGKSIVDNGGVESLLALANEMAGVSEEYGVDLSKRVGRVNGKKGVNSKAVGYLSMAVNDVRVQQNKADIVKALESKGISSRKAQRYADILASNNYELGTVEEWQNATGDADSYNVIRSVMDSSVNARNAKYGRARVGVKTAEDGTISLTEEKAKKVERDVLAGRYAEEADSIEATVSKGGKAKVISTDTEVTLQGIDHIETEQVDGKETDVVYLKVADADGTESTVAWGDVEFANRTEAVLYESFVNMGLDPAHFDAYIKNFNEADFDTSIGEAAIQYAHGFANAYRYGWANLESEVGSDVFASKLTDTARNIAYTIGKEAVSKKAEAKQAALDIAVAARKASGKGKARTKGKLHMADSIKTKPKKSFTRMQQAGIGLAKRIAELGIDVYLYESQYVNGQYVDENGEIVANGFFRAKDGSIHVDINAGDRGQGVMAFTLGHELVHYMRQHSPKKFKAFADLLFKWYGEKGKSVNELIEQRMAEENLSWDDAYEEVVARSCESFLTDSNIADRIIELQQTDKGLWETIRDKVLEFLDWMKSLFKDVDVESEEGRFVREFKGEIDHLYDAFYNTLADAVETHQWIGARDIDTFAEAKTTDGDTMFQHRAMEADKAIYREMLLKHGQMTSSEIDALFRTIDKALDVIKSNLEALDYAWEADIDDRAFAPIKPNSDSLYKVSLDFSTLCRKRILQQLVQARLQEALNKPLSREEGIAIRDELMKIQEEGRQIEIACALCYVESARMKSNAQIKKFLANREAVITEFLASKSGGSIKQKVAQAEAGARERLGVGNASLKSLPQKVADQIRYAKKKAKESYEPTYEEQKLIDAAMSMTITDFTTPAGLENLAKNYPVLFDAYTSYIRNATKSKGIENDTWFRAGDTASISDTLIANMNRENGLRSQSWSDFQVIHLLDYIAATIELSTRNAKEQAYSKVPDYIELMGNTGVMLNMSLIPTSVFNGGLEYDSVEGIDYKRSLALRDKYHATAGTICIGINNKQIALLLADGTIDYVIPYHKSGMAAHIRALMHIPKWDNYEDYQSEKNLSRKEAEANAKKYGVELLDESDPNYHKHTSFSEWFDLEVAQQIARMENANPSNKKAHKKYGVMYGGYMAMQNAANNYLRLCAERGIAPKFSHEKADFTAEENYWKLLIDRKMVDNVTGEIIVQQAIKPVFDEGEVLRILNDELDRYPKVKEDQEYAIRTVMERFLSGEMNSRLDADTIAAIMQKPVNNVTATSILASSNQYGELLSMNDETVGEVKYSRRENFADACDVLAKIGDKAYEEAKSKYPFVMVMDYTPQIILDSMDDDKQLNNRKVIIRRDALYLAIRGSGVQPGHYHELGAEALKKLPQYLENPDVILSSGTDKRIVLARIDAKNGQGLVSIEFESMKDFEGHNEFFNVIVTVFDLHRNYLKSMLRRDDVSVKYEKEDLVQLNPQLYEWLRTVNTKSSSEDSIAHSDPDVKDKKSSRRDPTGRTLTAMEMEERIFELRSEIEDITEQMEWLDYDDPEYKPLNNALFKARYELDKLVEEERRASVKTPLNEIISNLSKYRISDLYSIAEQFSDSAWDDYEDLSRDELESILREALSMSLKENGVSYLYVRPVEEKQGKIIQFPARAPAVGNALAEEFNEIQEVVGIATEYKDFKAWVEAEGAEKFAEEIVASWGTEGTASAYFQKLLDSKEHTDNEDLVKFVADIINRAIQGKDPDIRYSRRDYTKVGSKAVMTADRIDYLIEDSGAGSRVDYAQSWITSISPTDFLNMTLTHELQDRSAFDKFPSEWNDDATMDTYDYTSELKRNKRQTPYLAIDISTGKVVGHEGRHRIRALERQGIKSVEIRVEFRDEDGRIVKYSPDGERLQIKDTVTIANQFGTGQTASIQNVIPLNEDYRDTILANYGEATSTSDDDIRYSKRVIPTGIELPDGTKVDKDGKPRSAQAQRDAGYMLSESKFYSLYSAHKLNFGIKSRGWDLDSVIEDIRRNGFISTTSIGNVVPSSLARYFRYDASGNVMFEHIVQQRYAPRKGDTVMFVPNNYVDKYDIIKNGFKPLDYEIAVVEYDYQPYYELYTRAYDSAYEKANGGIRYQRRVTGMSNRSILANALEGATQNDSESRRLAEYKEKIDLINAEEEKLREVRARIAELSFASGPKDTATIKRLQETATRIASRINTYDKQLLSLEATAPLRALLEREKAAVRKREKERTAEAVARYREKSAETIREVMTRNTESRKRSVESRKRTVARNKIKRVVADLNGLLNRGTKERNVKTDMRETVGSALRLANVLFNDEITNEDIVLMGSTMATEEEQKLLEQYRELIEKRDSAPVGEAMRYINKISDLNRKLADLFKRERARLNQAKVSEAVDELAKAYAGLKVSDKDYVSAYYSEEAYQRLLNLSEALGGTIMKDMSLEQLEEVYNAYKMIRHIVRESNSLFRMGKTEDLAKRVTAVQEQILALYKEREKDPRAFAKKIGDVLKGFAWNEMKPLTAFETLGAEAFTELFWDAIKAEAEWAKWMEESKAFLDEQRKKYGYKAWDMESAHEFTLPDGKVFRLTLQDMMSIYAYSKRDQAEEHMTVGGFQFDKNNAYKDKSGKKRVRLGDLYVTDWTTIVKVIGELTDEQRGYVDAVQQYLTDMGKRGNEVSEILYGIGIFNETAYFPLMSAKDYRSSVEEALQATPTQVSLKNTGMTKQTVPHASNPIILQGFDDVVIGHIDKMAKYCTHVLAIENLRRVFDSVSADDNGGYVSTKAVIEKVFGGEAQKYINKYITDLNGGVFVEGPKIPAMAWFSKFKATAVGASLSVVVQQPFAVIRAMDVIDPKHFVGKVDKAETKRLYDEIMRYAPVAIIKEMGGFDVGSSRTARDYLGSGRDKGIVDKVNDVAMYGAGWADRVGWGIIWNAVKREVASEGKYELGSEEYLKACGERFTEVIVRTQVYDSVNSRSGFMRSKSDIDKFMTSFMGEPTTVVNQAYLAVLNVVRAKDKQAKKKAVGKLARTMSVLLASTLLNNLAKSFVYAMLDDDDDEAFFEKWAKHMGENLGLWGDLNPMTLFPYTRDLASILEGWDVERPDMTLIANVITSAKRLLDRDSDDQFTNIDEVLALFGDAANAFGIPAKNAIRGAKAIVNFIEDIFDDVMPTDVGGAFVSGFTGEEYTEKTRAENAFKKGDNAEVKRIVQGMIQAKVASGKTEKEAKSAVRSSFTSTYKEQYVKAYKKGDLDEMNRIRKYLHATGLYGTLSELDASLKKWRED